MLYTPSVPNSLPKPERFNSSEASPPSSPPSMSSIRQLVWLAISAIYTPFSLWNASTANDQICDLYRPKLTSFHREKWHKTAVNSLEWQVNTLERNSHMSVEWWGLERDKPRYHAWLCGKIQFVYIFPWEKKNNNEQFYKQTKFIFRLVLRQKGNTVNSKLGLPVSESKKRVIWYDEKASEPWSQIILSSLQALCSNTFK